MNSERYQELALRTAKFMETLEMDLVHAALGLTGEAGEFADAVKKHVIYGAPLDAENLTEELSDILWYVAFSCQILGIEIDQVMQYNIKKLAKRYPNGYSDLDAILRSDKL